jgi:hypothetical protein
VSKTGCCETKPIINSAATQYNLTEYHQQENTGHNTHHERKTTFMYPIWIQEVSPKYGKLSKK